MEQADNLKKYGGFIPGVRPAGPRPNTSTASWPGSRSRARSTSPLVAALPTILINQTSANFYFGGTSILIVVAWRSTR